MHKSYAIYFTLFFFQTTFRLFSLLLGNVPSFHFAQLLFLMYYTLLVRLLLVRILQLTNCITSFIKSLQINWIFWISHQHLLFVFRYWFTLFWIVWSSGWCYFRWFRYKYDFPVCFFKLSYVFNDNSVDQKFTNPWWTSSMLFINRIYDRNPFSWKAFPKVWNELASCLRKNVLSASCKILACAQSIQHSRNS